MSGKWSVVPGVPRLHERSAGATNNFGTYPEASDFRERVFGRPAAQTGFARNGGLPIGVMPSLRAVRP
jgi:hypothetical protein